jgi:polyisoprenoid-binding protein YceI
MTHPAPAGTTGRITPGDWVADPAKSTISFSVTNFGVGKVTGQMPLTSAAVTIGLDDRPVSIRAEVDASGIDTGNRRRDSDLRGPRFLGTATWPVISFTADHIESAEAGWIVHGTLRVKDVACPMRLNVAGPASLPSDPWAPVELCATGQVDRRSAGVTAAPAFLVGHQVAIALTVWLRPPTTETK